MSAMAAAQEAASIAGFNEKTVRLNRKEGERIQEE